MSLPAPLTHPPTVLRAGVCMKLRFLSSELTGLSLRVVPPDWGWVSPPFLWLRIAQGSFPNIGTSQWVTLSSKHASVPRLCHWEIRSGLGLEFVCGKRMTVIQSDFLPLLEAFHKLLLAACRPPRVRIGSSSPPCAHHPGARSMRAGEGLGWARCPGPAFLLSTTHPTLHPLLPFFLGPTV